GARTRCRRIAADRPRRQALANRTRHHRSEDGHADPPDRVPLRPAATRPRNREGMMGNPFKNAFGMFATVEERKLAAVHTAIAAIDAALLDADRAWKALAYDALEGTDAAKAAAHDAKRAYDALIEKRQFAVAAAAELEAQ